MSNTILDPGAVSPLELRDAGVLASFYNRLVEGTLFCYPVSEAEFAEGVVWKSPDHKNGAVWESPEHRVYDRLREQQLLVIRPAGEVLGFAQTALEHHDGVDRGVIRFLGHTPGERAAGQELLSRAEERLRGCGVREILAFAADFPYPFYHLGLGYLSDRLAHITGLLGVNGYTVAPYTSGGGRCEMFFAWPDYDVERPDKPDGKLTIGVEPIEGDGRLPNVRFRLRREGSSDCMGLCETYCVGHWTRAEDAQETFRISWLHIHDDWHTRGWGR